MDVDHLLQTLTDAGVQVTLNATRDGLLASPPACITPELAALIRANKPRVVAALTEEDSAYWHALWPPVDPTWATQELRRMIGTAGELTAMTS